MALPVIPEKYHHSGIIEPKSFLKYLKKTVELRPELLPDTVIICFQPWLMKHVRQAYQVKELKSTFPKLNYLSERNGKVAVVGPIGMGAPSAVMALECMIALGLKRFVVVGTAGALSESLNPGDFVIVDRAIRDEGTSQHYVPASRDIFASPKVTQRLSKAATHAGKKFQVGTTWTTDAPFRETPDEVKSLQEQGVLTVDMEAAALMTVAYCRGVEIGVLFSISDSIAHFTWEPAIQENASIQGLCSAFDLAASI